MAVLKIACPRCGQRVSGDESFFGTSVDCPVCSSKIVFPDKPVSPKQPVADDPLHDLPKADEPQERVLPDDLPQRAETPIELKPDTPKRREKAAKRPKAEIEEDDEDFHDDDDHPYDDEAPSPLLGILSMVLGILNVFTGCAPLAILLAPAAIICGHLALSKAQYSPVQPAPGRGMAIAGLVLGYLGLFVLLLVLVLMALNVIPNPFQSAPDAPVSQ